MMGEKLIEVLLELYWKVVLPCCPEYEELCWIASPPGKDVLVAGLFGNIGYTSIPFVGNMFGTTVGGGGYVPGTVGIGMGGIAGNGKAPNGV
jgi:hypothetical protein